MVIRRQIVEVPPLCGGGPPPYCPELQFGDLLSQSNKYHCPAPQKHYIEKYWGI